MIFCMIIPSFAYAGLFDAYRNMVNGSVNAIQEFPDTFGRITELDDTNSEILTEIGQAYLAEDTTDKQKSLIENQLSEEDLDYAQKSAKREEQALEKEVLYEKKKENLYSKINYIFDIYLVVFETMKEILILAFYFLEMYLLLLVFLKIIPFTFRKMIEALSGGFNKLTQGDNDR